MNTNTKTNNPINIFSPNDKVKMLRKNDKNNQWAEIGRGFISRIANANWVYYVDSEASNKMVDELVPVESNCTRLIRW